MLGVMMALAAMMLAAAPASAQDSDGVCEEFDGVIICDFDEFCEDVDGDLICDFEEFCEDVDGDLICDLDELCEDLNDNFICDFDEGAFFTDGITQQTEQEAESGDINQSFDVSQTGDNSNQTVGIQGVANTGNAQNVIDVVDAGPFVGDFDGNDGFFVCDFDNDGDNDECEEIVFCDFDDDTGDGVIECEDVVVFFPFFNDGLFFDGFDGFDGNGDVEFEDVGASIEVSPSQVIDSTQQVNQAAAASA